MFITQFMTLNPSVFRFCKEDNDPKQCQILIYNKIKL